MKKVGMSDYEAGKICRLIVEIDELCDGGLCVSDGLREAKRMLIETIRNSENNEPEKEP